MNLKKLNRTQLEELAAENGLENAEDYETNADLIAALEEVMPSESVSEEAKDEELAEVVEDEGLVEITLPKEDYGATAPVVVTVNGSRTEIALGVPTMVSSQVVEALKNSDLNFEITNKETN